MVYQSFLTELESTSVVVLQTELWVLDSVFKTDSHYLSMHNYGCFSQKISSLREDLYFDICVNKLFPVHQIKIENQYGTFDKTDIRNF